MGLKRFDFNLKDDKKKKSIIGASIIVLVLLVGITIYATYAAYKDIKTYNIIQGKVKEFFNADLSVAVKLIDTAGKETTTSDFPSHLEYAYLSDRSNCENGSEIIFDEGSWSATLSASEKDKCTLYFEKRSDNTLSEAILTNNTLIETTPNFAVATADGEYGLYSAQDDWGDSYYFRGDTESNYVKFGKWSENDASNNSGQDMYWRIVRINGDGSIRLVYDGTSLSANGTTHTTSIKQTVYNTKTNNAKYAGYTYDENGIQVDSPIKVVVDEWYEANLKTNYESYIEDGIFCNDLSGETHDTGVNFEAMNRMYNNKPVLTCTNKEDRYTVSDTIKGNGLLNNPVGLLSIDEVMMAGGTSGSGTTYYLYSNEWYWTSSPFNFVDYGDGTVSFYFWTVTDGWINDIYGSIDASSDFYARPVINLDANIKLYGTGTITDPYRLNK